MKITIIAAGACIDPNKETQKAGCAAKLDCVDNYDRHAERIVSYECGNATRPKAELSAAMLGLAAVSKKSRADAEVKLIASQYVFQCLDKQDGVYKLGNPSKNADDITKLRGLAEQFKSLTVEQGSKDILSPVYDDAKRCAQEQAGSDSMTRLV